MNRRFGLPLAASIAGHAALLAAAITLLGKLPPPLPPVVPERAVVVMLAPALLTPAPPRPAPPAAKTEQPPPPRPAPPPPKTEPPPKAEQPPKIEKPPPPRPEKKVERREKPPAPKPERRERSRPARVERRQPARIERSERRQPERRREYRRVIREAPRALPRERYAAPAPYLPPRLAYQARPVAVPRPPEPVRPAAPIVSAAYRGELSAWLQSHKRYPESARMSGEQGQALLRFRVARSGQVLSYAIVRSSGYPALDAAVEAMMRGAVMPPFPAGMSAPDIEVTVAVRFALGG